MFYKEILEQTGPGSAFLEHREAHILKNFLLGTNHGSTFMGSLYVPVCPKKLWLRHCTFFMSVLFRCFVRTAIFSRFLKVAIATSNFINKVYNGRFVPESSVSMLKETIVLVPNYVYESRK